MATNDGQKLLVFGLGFAQHDSRKMQQVLRHYNRMPSNPGSRAALFVELTKLGKELAVDEEHRSESQKVENWMKDGGEFPLGVTPAPINATGLRRHGTFHSLPTPGGGGQPLQHNNRYGPGHTLNDSEVNNQDVQDMPVNRQPSNNNENLQAPLHETQEGWRTHEDTDESNQEDSERGQVGHRTQDEDQAMGGLSDDDHEPWDIPVATRAAFHGRGRTLNDAEELTLSAKHQNEVTAPEPAQPPGFNDNMVPRLRGDQQWRGNNVHGLQYRRGGMGMGMGLPGMIPHHRRRPRPPRPRMEHDLEDEEEDDDDMAGLGGWNEGHGHFALGPGRTLNDPTPEQIQDPDHGPNIDPAFIVDESHHSDSDLDENDAASTGNPGDDNAEPVECPICLEEYPQSGFPRRPTITELCDHPDKACLQCLDSSITGIVESGALHILACPICPQKLSPRDVKEYANKTVYERYKYLRQQGLRPGHYISCTHPKCGGSQAHDCNGPSGPRMICNFCQAETCAKHRRPWHEGQTCLEFDMDPAQIERLEEEEATAKLLAKEATSICPKCGQGVTKTEGCDHMMCQCGTEWCYVVSYPLLCRADYVY